jgi:CRISPR-associated protein Cmr1
MRGANFVPAPITPVDQTDHEIRVTFEVVTPVHGGGVGWDQSDERKHIRPIDPVTPVRLSAVRGQLRFWWRAVFGCTMGSVAAMKAAEDELWGNASKPGLVNLALSGSPSAEKLTIFVSALKRGDVPQRWQGMKEQGIADGVAYGAFALKPPSPTNMQLGDGILTRLKGKVTLVATPNRRVSDDQRAQVEQTIRVWSFLGGVGGRIRRGFGAVVAEESNAAVSLGDFKRSQSHNLLARVPTLHSCDFRISQCSWTNPETAFEQGLETLRIFRQGENVGREPRTQDNKPAGRSRWPDADQVRRAFPGRYDHPARATLPQKCPRAAFGMPIIFHFQPPSDGPSRPDSELRPVESERMASPLWIRPIRVNGGFAVLALVLNVPHLDLASLVLKRTVNVPVSGELTPTEAALVPPLAQNGSLKPLPAFLNFFDKKLR